jgi:hypothetical protein
VKDTGQRQLVAARCALRSVRETDLLAASSVMKSRWSDAYCYVAGCGVDCHTMNFQPFGVCPGIEEHEPNVSEQRVRSQKWRMPVQILEI